jgi:hypothetical protein
MLTKEHSCKGMVILNDKQESNMNEAVILGARFLITRSIFKNNLIFIVTIHSQN